MQKTNATTTEGWGTESWEAALAKIKQGRASVGFSPVFSGFTVSTSRVAALL